ncbi:MAG: DNA-binding protein [Tannerellaceae bacterium]|jgi:predicted histone-like DNA-binding protein|nr:DNA-binding protein [Tannerellaceae bacterium]
MKYKVHTKASPANLQGKKLQYATPVNPGKMTLTDFSSQIAGRSSLTRGDIESVLTNFVEELPTFLRLGMSVHLGRFGTIRLTLSSEGVEEGKPFTANHIKGVRVIFTPSVEFKDSLQRISFEEDKNPESVAHEDEEDETGGGGGGGPVED